MNKFWIILGHTYTTRIKSKTFIITTLITLILIFALTNIKTIIDVFSDGEADQIAVIDETNELYKPLTENMKQTSEEIELTLYDGTEEEAKQAVEEEDYTALIVLTMNENKLPKATYYANSISQSSLQTTLEQQLQQLKAMYATEQAGVDPVALAMINEPVTFDTVALDKSAKTEEELNQARGIVYIMLFLLYITVIMYGNMIATDVATEKSSRVMEILISSAPPVTHMFAKIFGVALVGLTQIALFLGSGYALISAKDEATQELFAQFGIGSASMSIYIYAIVFFILGYLLYATLAAMLGSLVSRIEDAQQLTMPMIFLIMIAFIIAMSGLATPEAGFIKVTSFIPFFTPMIMFLRVGMLDVPIWEVALSIGLLIGTIIILALLGAKVYRGGVLMYGRSSSLKDFKKSTCAFEKGKINK